MCINFSQKQFVLCILRFNQADMNPQQKAFARLFFKLKIYASNGNEFEKLFTSIMNYSYDDFQQIKPWGNIGDRKNDGYIKSSATYFQVYAPEEISSSYPDVIKKIVTDYNGLKKYWSPINEFYFVLNEKYLGVNADCELSINQLIKNESLSNGGFFTPKDMERLLLELDEDKITQVIGFLPEISLDFINYSILNEVISQIVKLPVSTNLERIEIPDWDKKIVFNGLSETSKIQLNCGAQLLGSLNQYLSNDPFLAETLQQQLNGLYSEIKKENINIEATLEYPGDKIFIELIKRCLPKDQQQYLLSVLTILAKYFETCDIFENHN